MAKRNKKRRGKKSAHKTTAHKHIDPRLPCQIYLITPPHIDDVDGFAHILEGALKGLPPTAPIAALQIRLKDTPKKRIIETAKTLMPIVHKHGALVIINDDPDIALECGADGVHVGQTDMNIKDVKELLPGDAIIGVTCHNSKDLAFEASMAGADYVAFGAFFDSPTKPEATQGRPLADVEMLTWWNETMEIPCVAIGGMTPENAGEIIQAGADFIALSSGIWDHPRGPAYALAQLSALCALS
ncbi:MAG TPA: thiamine phosphate synthase [Hellea balneolensis]|uniref:Thiamine-phosphate synthase n=1 Tax=Hellea balneolensis TaxID=287478 RepID=A0A7C3FYR9_9PROT|nr:thiamine phosphate synthase [Hellea balneolensis]